MDDMGKKKKKCTHMMSTKLYNYSGAYHELEAERNIEVDLNTYLFTFHWSHHSPMHVMSSHDG